MRPDAVKVPVAIIAAGEGSRLAEDREAPPKPCRQLLGRSIAEWSLTGFVGAGLREFVVAVGFRSDEVGEEYERVARRLGCQVEIVVAEGWRKGNGVSALTAARAIGSRPFLLSMADHLFSGSVIQAVLDQPPDPGEVRLAVDRETDHLVDLADLTKVRLDGDRIVGIGKELAEWDAGDAGIFYCTAALADGLERAQGAGLHSLSDGVAACAADGRFRAILLSSGHRWMDIDTAADFAAAELRGSTWLEGEEG